MEFKDLRTAFAIGFSILRAMWASVGAGILVAIIWYFTGPPAWLLNWGFPFENVWQTVGVVGGLAFVVSLVSSAIDARHRRRSRETAIEAGFQYSESLGRGDLLEYQELAPFRGDWHSAGNCWSGDLNGIPFDLVDYTYRITSTDSEGRTSSSHNSQTVLILSVAPVVLPRFLLQPHRWVTFLSKVFSDVKSVTFDSSQLAGSAANAVDRFSRSYLLTVAAGDVRAAEELRKVCDASVLEWLADHPGWNIEFLNGRLAFWKSDTVLSARSRQDLLVIAAEFLSVIQSAQADRRAGNIPEDTEQAIRDQDAFAGFAASVVGAVLGFVAGGFLAGCLWLIIPEANRLPFQTIAFLLFAGSMIGGVTGFFLAPLASRLLVSFLRRNVRRESERGP